MFFYVFKIFPVPTNARESARLALVKTNETSCHPLKPGPPEMKPLVSPSPLKKCLPFEFPGDSDLLVVPFRGCQPPLLQRDLDTRNAGHHARAEHQIASGHTRLSQ